MHQADLRMCLAGCGRPVLLANAEPVLGKGVKPLFLKNPPDYKRLSYAAWECALHISIHVMWNYVYML